MLYFSSGLFMSLFCVSFMADFLPHIDIFIGYETEPCKSKTISK